MWNELNAALEEEDYRKAQGFIVLLQQYRATGWLPADFTGSAEEFDEHLRAADRNVRDKQRRKSD